jgi:hypothetical protein
LTVAPTTASPGFTSTGTDTRISVEERTADEPSSTHLVNGDLLSRAYDNAVAYDQVADRYAHLNADLATSVAQDGCILAPASNSARGLPEPGCSTHCSSTALTGSPDG